MRRGLNLICTNPLSEYFSRISNYLEIPCCFSNLFIAKFSWIRICLCLEIPKVLLLVVMVEIYLSRNTKGIGGGDGG